MKKEQYVCDFCGKDISDYGSYQIQVWFSPRSPTGSMVKTLDVCSPCYLENCTQIIQGLIESNRVKSKK